MKILTLCYVALAGLLTGTLVDFALCCIPCCLLLHRLNAPKNMDVYIFTPQDTRIAEAFVEHVIYHDPEYDHARILFVDADKVRLDFD